MRNPIWVWLTVASAILGISSASGADLATRTYAKAPIVAPAAVYDWNGFYIGGNVGYAWGDRSVVLSPNDFLASNAPGAAPPISFNNSGGLGGVQVGYNWQVNRNWLAGVETDIQYSAIKGRGSSSHLNSLGNPFIQYADDEIKWFGTVRGRLGYLFADSVLVYATGGFAYGRVNESLRFDSLFQNFVIVNNGFVVSCLGAPSPCFAGSRARTAAGWTAGGGIEGKISNNWSLKAEYLFVNLGSSAFSQATILPAVLPPGLTRASFTGQFSDTSFHVVRVGLNYSFNPVIVARY